MVESKGEKRRKKLEAKKKKEEQKKKDEAEKKKKEAAKKKPATKIVLRDECLAPYKNIYMYYNGPNPFSVVGKLWGVLDKFFEVSSAGFGEPEFYWDTSGDPITYMARWWVRRTYSKYSTIRYDIAVQGDEGAQTKKGRFTLEITANIHHSIPNTWFNRTLWWIYQYLFYTKRRMEYLRECRKFATGFREYAKKQFGMTETSAREPVMKEFD
ncbi:MAG TPA: hypothetical protein VJA47_02630 [archaeon]|nr:hypothetical protein [archaeon]